MATKRSRSMVRTDQLPWGESGEEGVRPAGVTLSPPLAPAWSHWPVTHQLSAKLWCLLPCPPRTHPRGMRAESSAALTQPGPPCVPAPPHLLAALGCVQQDPAAVGRPAHPWQCATVDSREGTCDQSGGTHHPPESPPAPPELYSPHACRGTASSTVLVCLVYQSYCRRHGIGQVLQGLSLPAPTAAQGGDIAALLPAPPSMGTLAPPWCLPVSPWCCSPCGVGCTAGGGPGHCSPGRRCGSHRG